MVRRAVSPGKYIQEEGIDAERSQWVRRRGRNGMILASPFAREITLPNNFDVLTGRQLDGASTEETAIVVSFCEQTGLPPIPADIGARYDLVSRGMGSD